MKGGRQAGSLQKEKIGLLQNFLLPFLYTTDTEFWSTTVVENTGLKLEELDEKAVV